LEIICLEDGTDTMFRKVGQYKPDAGKTPKRKHTEDLLSALKIKSSIVARMRAKADLKNSSVLSAPCLKP
jgi:hypothetical protein